MAFSGRETVWLFPDAAGARLPTAPGAAGGRTAEYAAKSRGRRSGESSRKKEGKAFEEND